MPRSNRTFNARELAKLDELLVDLQGDTRLVKAAETLNLSVRYFIHVFGNTKGCSWKRYVTLTQLARAKAMLLDGHTQYRTALDCGYTHASHMCTHFKAFEGMTPARFLAARLPVDQ